MLASACHGISKFLGRGVSVKTSMLKPSLLCK
jgi:hypothetical protein